MEQLARNIIKYRWITIVTVVALTVFLGLQISKLQLNPDIISSLPDEDPDAALLKEISTNFVGNNTGMIILETDNIFTTEVLEHVKTITDSVSMTEGISYVTSLTNVTDIKRGEEGLEIGKLVDEYDLPDTPEEFNALKERIFQKDTYTGTIVSEDGTATVILFTLSKDADTKTVARTIKEKTEALNLPEKLYFSGSPMMVTYISDLMIADLKKLIPIAFGLIIVILFLGFGSARGVILPLLVTTISIIWTMGIMGLVGIPMSMISSDIPIILLAVGTAYTIHVINKINQEREKDWKKATFKAMQYISIPVFLAALTTIMGFLSFLSGSYLHMIRDFGIFSALGTFFAFLLAVVFVPAIISFLPPSMKTSYELNKRIKKSYLSENILTPLHQLLFKHPKYTLTGWGILFAIGFIGIFFIQRSVDVKDYFRKENPARLAEELMIEKFGGTKPIFVMFKGDMQSPEVLKTMKRTEEYMKKNPYVTTSQSIADLIAELSYAMGDGRKIPDDRGKIEQLWFMLEGNEMLQQFVSEELDEGIIISKFTSISIREKKAFGKYMNDFIKENSTAECEIQITGMPFVDVTMDSKLIESQFTSVTVAIIFVIILLGLIVRSFLNGLFSSIPIITAIVLLFGLMGYSGIPLNIATVLVAAVAVGEGIGYSIHIIAYFNYSRRQNNDIKQALEDAITISGKAIVINVLAISAGFLVLVFSEFVPLQYFGLLVAICMVTSSLGAMTLLPVILILVNRRKNSLNSTNVSL